MNYKDCYVRPFAWRGGKLMGLSTTNSDVHVSIAVWDDWTTYYKLEDMKAWSNTYYFSLEETISRFNSI